MNGKDRRKLDSLLDELCHAQETVTDWDTTGIYSEKFKRRSVEEREAIKVHIVSFVGSLAKQ